MNGSCEKMGDVENTDSTNNSQQQASYRMEAVVSTLTKTLQAMMEMNAKLNARLDLLDAKLESIDTDVQKLVKSQDSTSHQGDNEIDSADVEYIKVIGTGNFATVHQCRWSGKDVAIKVMKTECVNTIGFMYEFTKMRRLRHKNLIRIHGLYEDHWPPHIVMEYGKGGSLLKYLVANKSTIIEKSKKLLQIGFQISQGLEYLESEGFIHRSLAARNCYYGDNQPCKIGDYGLTKVIPAKVPSMPIRWMSPEFFDNQEYSSKTDVWSLGVVIWEVFKCGKPPYGSIKNAEVVDIVCNKRGVLEKPQHCPEAVYNVMKQCWKYSPTERPTVANISSQLEQILQS